ncbi:hypothetical protein HMI56_004063 [Coelomomyces lativittatus]|nr:hypothetical protein HMI56_004063 [Coelomomyces lativittatus]
MSDCSTSHSCSTVTLRPGSLNQIEHTDMTYSLLHLPTEKKTFTSSKNFIVAEPISTTLLCPNCFQIYVDPVVMGCGHILCQGCTLLSSKLKNKDSCLELSTELKTLSNTTTLHPFSTSSTTTITTTSVMTSESLTETLERCPLCEPKRNEFNEIIPPTTLLQQIHNSLSTLLIECSLCNEYMLLTDFEKHHSEDCKSVLLQCSPQASCSTLDDEEHDPSTHSLRQTSMKPISSNNVSHVNESFENYVGNETGSSTSSLDASPVLESHPSYTLVSSLQQEEPFRFSLPFSLNEVATVEGQSFVQGVYFEYLPGIFEDLPHVHLFQQCVCRGVLPTIMVHETTELRNLEMDPPLRITLEDGNFALRFLGYYKAPVSGYYTFFLTSNDGSMLWLDHRLLISNSKKVVYL